MGQQKSKTITSEEVAPRILVNGQKKAGDPALESDRLEQQKSSRRNDSHRGPVSSDRLEKQKSSRRNDSHRGPDSTPRDLLAGGMSVEDTPRTKKALGRYATQ
jgi:hypothetical protein